MTETSHKDMDWLIAPTITFQINQRVVLSKYLSVLSETKSDKTLYSIYSIVNKCL